MGAWLEEADRFKNGTISGETVQRVMRDALILNGLPSPRESDVTMSLERASKDSLGLQFDRSKVVQDLEKLVRKGLCLKSGVTYTPAKRAG